MKNGGTSYNMSQPVDFVNGSFVVVVIVKVVDWSVVANVFVAAIVVVLLIGHLLLLL